MEGNHELVPQITISHSDSQKKGLGIFFIYCTLVFVKFFL